MSRNLAPYQAVLRASEVNFRMKLSSGRASANDIATARRAWEIMRLQIAQSPDSVLAYERMQADPRTGLRGPDRWRLDMYQRADEELFPHLASEQGAEAYQQKLKEYVDLGAQIVQSPNMRYRSVVDRQNGKSYLYQENPLVPRIMQVIATELVRWFEGHALTPRFLRQSAQAGLADFLSERPDMVALLRISQTLPLDSEVSEVPIERPVVVEAVEMAIGLIPVVGNVVAAYEAYSGRDLFGYKLTDLERGILAATVMLPLAGRLVKGGRAIYTEARLVSLYGRDASSWSRTLAAGGRATANKRALRTVEQVDSLIRVQQKLDPILAKEAVNALSSLVRGSALVSSAVDQEVTNLFATLSQQHRILASLDSIAMRRILEKGPNVDHLKGQLLEELLESRVVPWLRDRAGSFALGVQSGGKKLEFIPGHLVRDSSGRQITDGILGYRDNNVLEIMAVFEAKAGRRAARELSLASSSISSLSSAERAELRAYAKDVFREQQAAAQEAGRKAKTLEEVEREIALSERGGQVRRDIERLSANEDGTLAQVFIGAGSTPVKISPTRTKFFGILPKDVNASLIERELRNEGFVFEIVGVDINQRDLKAIAERLKPLAEQMASASP